MRAILDFFYSLLYPQKPVVYLNGLHLMTVLRNEKRLLQLLVPNSNSSPYAQYKRIVGKVVNPQSQYPANLESYIVDGIDYFHLTPSKKYVPVIDSTPVFGMMIIDELTSLNDPFGYNNFLELFKEKYPHYTSFTGNLPKYQAYKQGVLSTIPNTDFFISASLIDYLLKGIHIHMAKQMMNKDALYGTKLLKSNWIHCHIK